MKQLLAVFLAMFLVGCNSSTSDLVKKVENGVVLIENTKSETAGGIGTGFILADNQIVTNYHVIEGATKLIVYAKKTNIKYPATVVYQDKISDIAVLRLYDWELFKANESPANLKLGDSNKETPGSEITVIGHPWGLAWTVSEGIISAKNRRPQPTPKFLDQVDAKLFQGNSGGPIFNRKGEVVCVSNLMVVVKESGSYGFCIPSSLVKKVLYDFNKFGEVRWRAMNISLKMSDDGSRVVVNSVDEGGAADKAGIKAGDSILKYFDKQIYNSENLMSEVAMMKGDEEIITLTIERDNQSLVVDLKSNYKTEKDFSSIKLD